MPNWSRRIVPPVETPEGKTLRTLKTAAEYVLALPEDVQAERPWQHAADCLRNAAEREIAWMWFVRPSLLKALHGEEPAPIGNPKSTKSHRWGERKLARDR